MRMYPIEHDLPPPPARTNRPYAFEKMNVGDSFLVPCKVTELTALAQRVQWAAKRYRRRIASQTRWRTKSTQGVRIWRVE